MAKTKNPETLIMDQIKGWLESQQIFVRRMQVGGLIIRRRKVKNKTMSGFPDLWGILPGSGGKMFVIEVKCPGEVLEEDQVKWMWDLATQGVVTILARSLDDAIKAMAIVQTEAISPRRINW